MANKVVLDTNVILDLFISERQSHEAVTQLLSQITDGEYVLHVVSTSLKDVYYIISKYSNEAHARKCISAVFISMEVLAVDSRVVYEGFHGVEPDFEDGIIAACVDLNHMDYLVTRDAKAFKKCHAKTVSPAELLEIIG